jgi:hypothetical protein
MTSRGATQVPAHPRERLHLATARVAIRNARGADPRPRMYADVPNLSGGRRIYRSSRRAHLDDTGGMSRLLVLSLLLTGCNGAVPTHTIDIDGGPDMPSIDGPTDGVVRYGEVRQLPQAVEVEGNFIVGQPITVPEAGTLRRVGIITAQGAMNVVVGIYRDAFGKPNELVAQVTANLVFGTNEIELQRTDLSADVYWFMALYRTGGEVYASTAKTVPTKGGYHSFFDPLQPIIQVSSEWTAPARNYYLVMDH